MNRRAYTPAIFLALLLGGCLNAIPPDTLTQPGNGSVGGTITDFCKGQGLEGVDVTAKSGGQRHTVSTGPGGTFMVADLSPGEWTLSLSSSGYQTLEKSVLVQSDHHQTLALSLSPTHKPTIAPAKLDLLFVVDNSGSMAPKQQKLASALPRFISSLLDFKLMLDLRIGIISTDIGAGNLYTDQSCVLDGDKGKLIRKAFSVGCPLPTSDFISVKYDVNGGAQSNVPGDKVVEAFSCMVQIGSDGCGFEQPLGALQRALDQKLNINPGFLRLDAALGVVILTDEDDCTVKGNQLFDPSQQGLNDPLGPLTSFRCFEFGVTCTCPGHSKCTRYFTGARTACKPLTGGGMMLEPAKVVSELNNLRTGRLFLSVIAGNADKVAVQMKGSYPSLASSCQSSNSLAFPAVRLKAVTDALAPASSFDTICLDSLDQTMQTVARSMAQSVLLSPCKP